MRIFACVDERMGMLFNHRRQSRDREVITDILNSLGPRERLTVSSYSAKLFPADAYIQIIDDAASGDTDGSYFLEDPDLAPPADAVDSIQLYHWNRTYPYDKVFPYDLAGWTLQETREFSGTSHEKITKEVYARNA